MRMVACTHSRAAHLSGGQAVLELLVLLPQGVQRVGGHRDGSVEQLADFTGAQGLVTAQHTAGKQRLVALGAGLLGHQVGQVLLQRALGLVGGGQVCRSAERQCMSSMDTMALNRFRYILLISGK